MSRETVLQSGPQTDRYGMNEPIFGQSKGAPFWELLRHWRVAMPRKDVPFFLVLAATVTLPKFNSSPLKNGGWKTRLSYWEGNFFRGYVKLRQSI